MVYQPRSQACVMNILLTTGTEDIVRALQLFYAGKNKLIKYSVIA